MKNTLAKNITIIGLLASILSITCPLSIQIGIIPISLATLSIYIISLLFSYKVSLLAVAVYILLGICGLPVFANFIGGLQAVTGVTGGFILGYIPLSITIGLLNKFFPKNRLIGLLSTILGTILLYLIASVWFSVITKNSFIYSIKICVLPFVIFDAIKIIIANIVCQIVKKRIPIRY